MVTTSVVYLWCFFPFVAVITDIALPNQYQAVIFISHLMFPNSNKNMKTTKVIPMNNNTGSFRKNEKSKMIAKILDFIEIKFSQLFQVKN